MPAPTDPPTIAALPESPSRGMSADEFAAKAEAWVAALPGFGDDMGDVAAWMKTTAANVYSDSLVVEGSLHRIARTSNTILGPSERNTLIDCTGIWTQTFTAAATLGDGWYVYMRNSGTSTIGLDPNGSETIDGLPNGQLRPGMTLLIICDGSAFHCLRVGPPTAIEVKESGTSWTCPLGVRCVKVTVVGGGGSVDANDRAAGGGGAVARYYTVTPGTSYSYAVGAAGTGSGGGGNSTFTDGTTTIQGSGGPGGASSGVTPGGGGSTVGTLLIPGGKGIAITGFAIGGDSAFGVGAMAVGITAYNATGYGAGGARSSTNTAAPTGGAVIFEY